MISVFEALSFGPCSGLRGRAFFRRQRALEESSFLRLSRGSAFRH